MLPIERFAASVKQGAISQQILQGGSANVVVIGGGIVGCSIAYHLTQLDISDVVCWAQKLTSGTTWHAAGLVASCGRHRI